MGVVRRTSDAAPSEKPPAKPTANEASEERPHEDPSLWQWITPVENTVALTDGGFTITAPNGAALAATFVTPLSPKIHVHKEFCWNEVNYHFDHQYARFDFKAIRAEGSTEFFVVLTLQKGDPPGVRVRGSGLGASAEVGGRSVSFDGERIVLGGAEEQDVVTRE